MKNLFAKVVAAFVTVLLVTSCAKEDSITLQPKAPSEIKSINQAIAVELLTLAKNESFRALVLDECLKQEHGDYNVYLRKLVNMSSDNKEIKAGLTKLKPLVMQLHALYSGNEPILFYPKAEAYENNTKKSAISGAETSSTEQLVAVLADEYVPTNQTCPGYVVDNGDQLVYYKDIDEEYAWLNDVWVIGEEENVSPENMVSAPEDSIVEQQRVPGQAEYTGYIQVTDLGAIESWVSGKLEFATTVFSSSGNKVWGTKKYGKWKRKNFKDQKWVNFGNSFIGNWNTSVYGPYMFETWMEEDGGQSSETTVTFTTPPNSTTGAPGSTITTKTPSRDRDDNLGGSIIQFTDDIEQVYNISYMNFKRRN